MAPGDEEFCFPLSLAEMQLIREAGHAGDDCFVSAANTPGFVEQLALLIPDRAVRTAFSPEGSHWRLATTDAGHCVFLGPAGCALPRSARPMYCRLFPLWSFQGRLTWFTAQECLASEECVSLKSMLRAMRTDSDEVRALFADMCARLGLEPLPKVKR
jgi:Fe-S-cluster containining protein